MRISHLHIENFRCFRMLDVALDEHVVIVGENKVGKSNLIHSLRLLLDPTLPESSRQLRVEDFWDDLARPHAPTDRIHIWIDITNFEHDPRLIAVLADFLVEPSPMKARLNYVYQPKPSLTGPPLRDSDYEYLLFGGNTADRWFDAAVRRAIPLDTLHALRDADGDLANWRRSPLRPLLDEAAGLIPTADLRKLAETVHAATNGVVGRPEIDSVAKSLRDRLVAMVGTTHAVETSLGFSPTDPDRLVRAIRLFFDNGSRPIADASLGCANLLYLALKSLEIDQLVKKGSRQHTILAIEEPEAHLHPHVQRLVYRDFLRPRQHLTAGSQATKSRADRTVLLTTHSPHIVSVAPLRSLVVVRKSADKRSSIAKSIAATALDPADIADLERYLDVTRGECVFARGILLVEGEAECYLLPVLGKLLGYDFDELGITVCSVAGVNFAPYVKLFSISGLSIPYAILTDLDPTASGVSLGVNRAESLRALIEESRFVAASDAAGAVAKAKDYGIFLNEWTLEVDLFRSGHHVEICQTIEELTEVGIAKTRARAWAASPGTVDLDRMLADIGEIGKGRFAQRLATKLKSATCPPYIKTGIEYVVALAK
jgi:putative ATP-dependent endonuclease of the OLD family